MISRERQRQPSLPGRRLRGEGDGDNPSTPERRRRLDWLGLLLRGLRPRDRPHRCGSSGRAQHAQDAEKQHRERDPVGPSRMCHRPRSRIILREARRAKSALRSEWSEHFPELPVFRSTEVDERRAGGHASSRCVGMVVERSPRRGQHEEGGQFRESHGTLSRRVRSKYPGTSNSPEPSVSRLKRANGMILASPRCQGRIT